RRRGHGSIHWARRWSGRFPRSSASTQCLECQLRGTSSFRTTTSPRSFSRRALTRTRSASPPRADRLRSFFEGTVGGEAGTLDDRTAAAGDPRHYPAPPAQAGWHLTSPLALATRWALAELWRSSGRVRGDRRLLYGGQSGLRILTFHETKGEEMKSFQRIVGWCRSRFAMATPSDADQIAAGRWPY